MNRVRVELEDRSHDVVVGQDLLGGVASHLPPPAGAEKAFIAADPVVAARWLEPLAAGLSAGGLAPVLLSVPRGEEAKTTAVAEGLYRSLARNEAHRDDLMVALGGGATGDLAGFVAATYMRGLPFLQVPTTLTAQVDASVGGKTAVNLPEGKNLVGAFHQPVGVLSDVGTLRTLPEREFRSGLAEVAKYALTLDPGLLDLLDHRVADVLARQPDVLEELVTRCVRAKAAVVAADERDAAGRLVLNYGHTLGHALERLDGFGRRSHGEAISVGMVFAARLSEALGVGPPGLAERHARLLSSLGLPVSGPVSDAERVLEAIRVDKKYRAGVRFVLLADLGAPRVVGDVEERLVRGALASLAPGDRSSGRGGGVPAPPRPRTG